ncbi:MAG: plasmid pRiA4b ORF-3 family protein, partial [bacterium]|nr:plasmid pRiA4b ORF-3 family protein [bacterium]
QTAFGWSGRHPFRFRIRAKLYIGVPDDDPDAAPAVPPIRLADLRLYCKERFQYEYNFGHSLHRLWRVAIRLEKRLPREAEQAAYPRCVGGVGSAPPEECGGAKAFEELRNLFTPAYFVQRLAEMLDQGFTDEHLAELRALRPWMSVGACDRRAINRWFREGPAGEMISTGVQRP